MYCEKCGAQIEENYAFCKFCGTPVGTASQNNQGVQQPPNIPQTFYPNVPYGYPQPMPVPPGPPKKHKGWLIALVSVLVVAVLVTGGVFLFNYSREAAIESQMVSVKISSAGGQQVAQPDLDKALSILKSRLDDMKITYRGFSADYSKNCVNVKLILPSENGKKTVESLGAQGKFVFKSDDYKNGEIFITNDDIKKAAEESGAKKGVGGYIVAISLNASGTAKFAEATKVLVNKQGAFDIYLDGKILQRSQCIEVITDGKFHFYGSSTGPYTKAQATLLAAQLNSDALPFATDVTIIENKK